MILHRPPGAGIQWTVSEKSEAGVEERPLGRLGTQSERRIGDKQFLEYEV